MSLTINAHLNNENLKFFGIACISENNLKVMENILHRKMNDERENNWNKIISSHQRKCFSILARYFILFKTSIRKWKIGISNNKIRFAFS